MPEPEGEIGTLVESLDSELWTTVLAGLTVTESNVVMPKYTLEYELEMKDVLTALGMGIAFVEGPADFSKICCGPGDIWIGKVKHKTFVEVNEEGTEAAAVTSVEMEFTSVPATVYIDRPFLFVIRERLSGTILFMGLIMDPTLTD